MLPKPTPFSGGDCDAQARAHPRATEVIPTGPARRDHRRPGGRLRPRPPDRAKPAEAVPRARDRRPAPRLPSARAVPPRLCGRDPRRRLGPAPRTPHLGRGLDPRRAAPAAIEDLLAEPEYAASLVPTRRTGAGPDPPTAAD